MAVNASLRLLLLTEKGEPLNERVEIRLRSETAGLSKVEQQIVTGPIVLDGLIGFTRGPCLLEIIPTTFQPETRTCHILPARRTSFSSSSEIRMNVIPALLQRFQISWMRKPSQDIWSRGLAVRLRTALPRHPKCRRR